MRRRTRGRRSGGFSLIEVMVSGAILLVGLAGVMSGIANHLRLQEHQRHMTQAIHLAEGVMERLLLAYPTDENLAVGSAHGPKHYNATGHEVASGGRYQVRWVVTDATPIPGIKRLDVRVEWSESLGNKTYELQTWRR